MIDSIYILHVLYETYVMLIQILNQFTWVKAEVK